MEYEVTVYTESPWYRWDRFRARTGSRFKARLMARWRAFLLSVSGVSKECDIGWTVVEVRDTPADGVEGGVKCQTKG